MYFALQNTKNHQQGQWFSYAQVILLLRDFIRQYNAIWIKWKSDWFKPMRRYCGSEGEATIAQLVYRLNTCARECSGTYLVESSISRFNYPWMYPGFSINRIYICIPLAIRLVVVNTIRKVFKKTACSYSVVVRGELKNTINSGQICCVMDCSLASARAIGCTQQLTQINTISIIKTWSGRCYGPSQWRLINYCNQGKHKQTSIEQIFFFHMFFRFFNNLIMSPV